MLAWLFFLVCLLCFAPLVAIGQQGNARALVRKIVTHELTEDAHDHSHWMYRDADKVPGKSTVKLVVQTAHGDISKTIAMDGHPLTAQERKDDEEQMHRFVTDPAIRQKQKQDNRQDAKKARSLTEMLPEAFLWRTTAQHGNETTLAFKPDPNFKPPTREARVFAAMEGSMVVNTKQRRIVALKGVLTQDIDFGWGLLGKLEKGGTFDVQRTEVGPHIWEITATHVHIQGHALIFKSISEQQDEETSDYKRAPRHITLQAAAKALNDGAVARELGLAPH